MSQFFDLVTRLKADIDALNSILSGDESTTVSVDGIVKDSISKSISDQFAGLKAMMQGRLSFATKAAMDGDLAHGADTLAEVWNDPTESNNGLYGKTGASGSGSWVKSPYDSYAELQAELDAFNDSALNGQSYETSTTSRDLRAVFTDQNGNVIAEFPETDLPVPTGEEVAKLLTAQEFDTTYEPGVRLALTDEDGNVIAELPETDFPLPTAEAYAKSEWENVYSLRVLRQKLWLLEQGETTEADGTTPLRATIALIGDSWTDNEAYWAEKFADTMMAKYGDGGVGWFGFGTNSGSPLQARKNVRNSIGTYVTSDDSKWTFFHGATDSVDMGGAESSDTSARIIVTIYDNTPATHYFSGGAYLHAEGGEGQLRYSWDEGGSWQIIDLSALSSGIQVLQLQNAPQQATTYLWLEPVAGTPKLYGVDFRSTAPGVVIHKLASSGASFSTWLGRDYDRQAVPMRTLNPDGFFLVFATNDQNNSTPEQFFDNFGEMVNDRLREDFPLADMFVVQPSQNGLDRPERPTIAEMSFAARRFAKINDCAFLDLQQAFGKLENYRYSDNGSTLSWLGADGAHPTTYDTQGGGVIIVRSIVKFIENF